MSRISAFVPCYNNRATVLLAVRSLQEQSVSPGELFVVDDGSIDGSPEWIENHGIRVLRSAKNLGRGATRARAMAHAEGDLVLSCDAANALHPSFLSQARPWFQRECVAAVFGRIDETAQTSAAGRWCARHLLKVHSRPLLNHHASLATGGVVIRKSAALAVGNFNPALRHSEDADLGERLIARGYEVVFDPALRLSSLYDNTIPQLLERYWRWYAGKDERTTWKGYFRQIVYSIKVLAREDLASGDPLGVPISLMSPHYQFWRSRWRRKRKDFSRIPTC